MTYVNTWEEFEKAAEHLYLQEPSKVRYVMKYIHSKNQLVLKMTDNVVVRKSYNRILMHVKVSFVCSVYSLKPKLPKMLKKLINLLII